MYIHIYIYIYIHTDMRRSGTEELILDMSSGNKLLHELITITAIMIMTIILYYYYYYY